MKKILGTMMQLFQIKKQVLFGLKMIALSLLFAQFTYAQVKVTGKVTDSNGETLPGVNILEKGTTNGTITDMDGNFSINVNGSESILIFSMVGMSPQEVTVGEQTIIDIIMEEDDEQLEEVVVIGYGTMKKSDLTGAVGSVKSESLEKVAVSNPAEALQGQIAGVSVTKVGGAPGTGSNVVIRGIGTLNNNTPLYIVDGLPGSMYMLNPNDIESIEVLKDGAAAAIYGAEAANGVVLITTKKGKKGAVKVEYNMFAGQVEHLKQFEMLDAQGYRDYNLQRYASTPTQNLPLYLTNPISDYANTNWQEEMKQHAVNQQHTIRISGGSDLSHYSLSAGITNEQGTLKGSGYNKKNIRLSTGTIKGRLTTNVILSYNEDNYENIKFSIREMYELSPLIPVYDNTEPSGFGLVKDGLPNNKNVFAMDHFNEGFTKRQYFTGNLNLKLNLYKGLDIQSRLGYQTTNRHHFAYAPPYVADIQEPKPYNELSEDRSNWRSMIMENLLTYENSFGKHNINALAGYTASEESNKWIETFVRGVDADGNPAGFLDDDFKTLNAGIGGTYSAKGSEWTYTRTSILGRIAYNFDSKYYLQATIRRDGSSKFGSESRYGVFPSVALGWTISNENFMKSLTVISNLKLRASWGTLGNEISLGYYDHQVLINTGNNYRYGYVQGINRSVWVGSIAEELENKKLRWEVLTSRNIGIDFGILDNQIEGSLEYYNNLTKDMLMIKRVPKSSGLIDPLVNIGDVRNTGIELSLGYKKRKGDFKFDVKGSFTSMKNELVKLANPDQEIAGGGLKFGGAPYTTKQLAGYPIASFFLFKTDGIFQSQDEIDAHNSTGANGVPLQPEAQPGDLRFVDVNGDGVLDNDDKVYMGSGLPTFEYSLNFNANYKNFDLNLFFYGLGGNKIINGNRYLFESGSSSYNQFATIKNAWTPTNTNTDMPRVSLDDPNGNTRASDRWLENGGFLKLKTLQVGYSLPKSIIGRVKIEKLRVYVSAQNLLTITSYSGLDPEIGRDITNDGDGGTVNNIGIDGSFYPMTRTYLFGVQVSF